MTLGCLDSWLPVLPEWCLWYCCLQTKWTVCFAFVIINPTSHTFSILSRLQPDQSVNTAYVLLFILYIMVVVDILFLYSVPQRFFAPSDKSLDG